MLGQSLSIMFSNPLVAFATAFALPAAPAWAQSSRRVSTFDEAINSVEDHHRINTALGVLSENSQERPAEDLNLAHPG